MSTTFAKVQYPSIVNILTRFGVKGEHGKTIYFPEKNIFKCNFDCVVLDESDGLERLYVIKNHIKTAMLHLDEKQIDSVYYLLNEMDNVIL